MLFEYLLSRTATRLDFFMMTETVYVPDISCAHCTQTIEREMMDLGGMKRVTAELGSKRVTFTYEAPATVIAIEAEMEEIGYSVPDRIA